MEIFLTVIAVLFAVALLFRTAVNPQKPRFDAVHALPPAALVYRLRELGKRCSVIKRGFGIGRGGDLCALIKKTAQKHNDGNSIEDWERLLLINKDVLLSAYYAAKSDARMCYALGHVNGVPRLYLLCREIAVSTRGDLSRNALKKYLDEFEKWSPLDRRERMRFRGMMLFCLCGVLHSAAEAAAERSKQYSMGNGDGAESKVDLDKIASCDYVCGLCASASAEEKPAILRLLETNGVSVSDADVWRRKNNADMYMLVKNVVSAISLDYDACIGSADGITADDKREKHSLSHAAVVALSVIPIALSVLAAVLICVFVPARFAALHATITVVLYGCFRLPLLLFASEYRSMNKFFRLRQKPPRPIAVNNMSELASDTVTVGNAIDYYSSEIGGEHVILFADNRGEVRVSDRNNRGGAAWQYLRITATDGTERIDLPSCDSAFERHKSVFHGITGHIELSCEFIVPVENKACCCRITAVNRGAEQRMATLSAQCAIDVAVDGKKSRTKIFDDGAAVIDGSRVTGLVLCGGAANVRNEKNNVIICTERTVALCPFGKSTVMLYIVYGESLLETDRTRAMLDGENFYSSEEERSRMYYCGCGSDFASIRVVERTDGTLQCVPLYPTPAIENCADKEVYLIAANGVFYDDGTLLVDKVERDVDSINNAIAHDNMCAVFSSRGVDDIFVCDTGKSMIKTDTVFADESSVCIAISEGGTVWLPMQPPPDAKCTVENGLGYQRYTCAYNGCIVTIDCTVNNTGVVVLGVTVKNAENSVRELDIMMSLLVPFGAKLSVVEDGVAAVIDGYLSTLKCVDFSEACLYREGYFVRGKIDRASGFRSGGTTPAPTVSAHVVVKPCGASHTEFYISVGKNADEHSIAELQSDSGDINTLPLRVRLRSDSHALDLTYMRAACVAYTRCIARMSRNSIRDECIHLAAVKYIDAGFVRSSISEMCVHALKNRKKMCAADILALCAVIVDYAEFSQDYGLLDRVVKYKAKQRSGNYVIVSCSIAELCTSLIDCSEFSFNLQSVAQSICAYNSLIKVLRYFYQSVTDATIKKRLTDKLARAAEKFDSYCAALKRGGVGAFCKSDIMSARALYVIGKNDKAYSFLSRCLLPTKFGLTMCSFDSGSASADAALFFITVTECLLGIEFSGATAKLDPGTAFSTPKIEYDLFYDGGKVTVDVDNQCHYGEWRMCIDRINYPAGSVKLSCKSGANIKLYRNGM